MAGFSRRLSGLLVRLFLKVADAAFALYKIIDTARSILLITVTLDTLTEVKFLFAYTQMFSVKQGMTYKTLVGKWIF